MSSMSEALASDAWQICFSSRLALQRREKMKKMSRVEARSHRRQEQHQSTKEQARRQAGNALFARHHVKVVAAAIGHGRIEVSFRLLLSRTREAN